MRILAVLAMVFGLLSIGGCGTVGHHVAGIENFDQVSKTLFRGAQPSDAGVKTLAGYGVKTVINLRDGDDTAEAQEVRDAGMTYVRLPLDAETVTPADAEKFLQILTTAQAPVFVHCLVGRDRTGMAVAAYRLRVQGWTQEAALQDLNDHGHFWGFFPKVRAAVEAIAQGMQEKKRLARAGAGADLRDTN